MNLKSYWPALIWAIVIFGLHIIPSDKIPKPPDWSFSVDKLVHFFIFACLSFLMLRHQHFKLGTWNGKIILMIIVLSSVYGLLMETVQLAVPGREFNLIDLVADGLGALAGNFVYIGFVKLKKGLGQ